MFNKNHQKNKLMNIILIHLSLLINNKYRQNKIENSTDMEIDHKIFGEGKE